MSDCEEEPDESAANTDSDGDTSAAQDKGDGSSVDDGPTDVDDGPTDVDDADVSAQVRTRRRLKLTKWTYLTARNNYRRMLCGLSIRKRRGTRACRGNVAIAAAVSFLYRSENTSTLSWGSTRVKVGGKTEVISARNRLRSRNRLWTLYNEEMIAAGAERRNRLQRSSFFSVMGEITERDLKVCSVPCCVLSSPT